MSIFYHSTRSQNDSVTSKKAIITGIANDGGLFVRDGIDSIALDLAAVCAQDYHANARFVLGSLLPDYTPDQIGSCVDAAYGAQFDSPAVTPVTPLGDDSLLELFHGPTSAFKDVALQMLPQLMRVARAGIDEQVMIVTATSGDTGKAALAGFADVPGCGVTVFYPAGKVSDVQRLQMVTQTGSNVSVCAVEGTFDDAQTAVKQCFASRPLADRLAGEGIRLSSANSINIGRLAPQVTYYLDAYAQLVRGGKVTAGDEVDFFVPTGNFGDVLAGYFAKLMGLPVGRLVVASNSNDVLFDFLTTGTYDRRRPFVKTISPSMDILVSSNLERLLYYASDGDCELVAHLMDQLARDGSYSVPSSLLERIQQTFSCGWATDDQTSQAIRDTWETDHVLIDPHTAVAKHVLDSTGRDGRARVCLATASPFKFSSDVLSALGRDTTGKDGFVCMDELSELTGIAAPSQLSALRDAPVRFSDTIAVADVPTYVEGACSRTFA